MQKRRLGQTELEVSRIGLGTVKFGRNEGVKYPQAFQLPSDVELKNLLSIAKEAGINLLDTAPAYGSSEERLGALLTNRHDWILATKVGETFQNGESTFNFSKMAMQQSIERSLQRLRTDYLDIVLVHSNGDDERLIEETDIFADLEQLKIAGKIRAFGMSSKTVMGGLLTLQHADVAMVTYNPVATEEQIVIQEAARQRKGILIKKAFASGHLQQMKSNNPVKTALDFVFAEPGVTSVIVGTINAAHLQESIDCVVSPENVCRVD